MISPSSLSIWRYTKTCESQTHEHYHLKSHQGPRKSIWMSVAPTKVKCFTWLVVRRACLTHEALQETGIWIASRCSLCKEHLETNNHFFFIVSNNTRVGIIYQFGKGELVYARAYWRLSKWLD